MGKHVQNQTEDTNDNSNNEKIQKNMEIRRMTYDQQIDTACKVNGLPGDPSREA